MGSGVSMSPAPAILPRRTSVPRRRSDSFTDGEEEDNTSLEQHQLAMERKMVSARLKQAIQKRNEGGRSVIREFSQIEIKKPKPVTPPSSLQTQSKTNLPSLNSPPKRRWRTSLEMSKSYDDSFEHSASLSSPSAPIIRTPGFRNENNSGSHRPRSQGSEAQRDLARKLRSSTSYNKLPSFTREEIDSDEEETTSKSLGSSPPSDTHIPLKPTQDPKDITIPQQIQLEIERVSSKFGEYEETIRLQGNHIQVLYQHLEKEGQQKSSEIRKLRARLTEIREAQLCPVCMDAQKNWVLNCGHCFCKQCAGNVSECPVCRQPRTSMIQVFM